MRTIIDLTDGAEPEWESSLPEESRVYSARDGHGTLVIAIGTELELRVTTNHVIDLHKMLSKWLEPDHR